MEIKYPLAKDTVNNEELDKLADWIKTHPRLTMGPLTVAFEKKWSRWLGRKYSVFVNSGSSANMLMAYTLLCSKRLKNNKVIVPCCGWPTTITPFIQFGFNPIMCDADPDTWGLNINHLESLLKKYDPSTVIFVQVLGTPNKMEPLLALKEKYGFALLEDSCAAMGSSYHGKKVGTFGDMSSMSTYYGHQFSTFEGGLVSTDDKDLYELMLMLRSHGWDKQLPEDSRRKLATMYDYDLECSPFIFYKPGFNVRPTDLQAFVGLGQLDKMDWLVERRHANHQLYKKLLGENFGTQSYENSTICSIHFCCLSYDQREQKAIYKTLAIKEIESRLFTASNLGAHPFWFERYGRFNSITADRLHNCGVFLPNNPSLNTTDIEHISSVVIQAAVNFRRGER